MDREYDFVIVGGGTAGCIVASRLAAMCKATVLLIEAGPSIDKSPSINDAAQFSRNIGSQYDWQYGNNAYPAGKLLGGSSNLNACIFVRGNANDYAHWPDGWQYDDLLPYFKKSENCEHIPREYIQYNIHNRGMNGPIKLSLPSDNGKNLHPYTQSFIDACVEQGYQYIPDINIKDRTNQVALHQFNIFNKTRQAVDLCYLTSQDNLTIASNQLVAKILLNNQRAIGVQCYSGATFKAKHEVILCAGTIGTPKILMLSGIGNKADLNALGLECHTDLPVGEHYQDHFKTPMLFTSEQDIATNRFNCSDSGIQASLFLDNNIQISFVIDALSQNLKQAELFTRSNQYIPSNGFAIFPGISTANIKGKIRLTSTHPLDTPILDIKPFELESDIQIMRTAMKIIRNIIASNSFKQYYIKELIDNAIPRPSTSDEYLIHYIQKHSVSQAHASCSCSIGNVVDEKLLVFNIDNLRIVDASVLPDMINANIQATIIAIAEKASDLIINQYNKCHTSPKYQLISNATME